MTALQKSDGQTGHTLRPWELRVNGMFHRVVNGEHKNTVADGIVSEHNARLIAAAPELLAALQGILDAVGTEAGEGEYRADDREGCLDYVEFTARAAITKATGQ